MLSTATPGWFNNILRNFISLFDRAVYELLEVMYDIFFNVANANLLSNSFLKNFYYRCQLIIGVFMIFKLAVTFLEGIMNPDKVMDKKNGAGTIVARVITSLVLLVLITPINIPTPSNEWEEQLNNNGILFGALYSLQHRILSNHTISRIILNTTDSVDNSVAISNKNGHNESKGFASSFYKIFFRLNVYDPIKKEPANGMNPEILT